MELTEALQWRYAAKRMNGRTVAPAQLNPILEAIRLAPSSRGLQPYQVLVVSSSELKSQIQPIADHQPQVVECSHLLILAVWNHVTQVQIEQFIAYAAKERGI
ncbi:MAG TPA: nitroreductase family protein, partial [Cytophagales bacterium]|nr:nitroreductase family protein [Cytophagales bacterium]